MDPTTEQPPADELPTYESLAQQEPTNGRFGRWLEWIEKRGLERHGESQLARRHFMNRGLGDIEAMLGPSPISPSFPGFHFDPEILSVGRFPSAHHLSPDDSQRVSIGKRLMPSNASIHNFGSRFIPHSTSRINAILPIISDRFLLIGSDDGLSVLDALPALHGGTSMLNNGILSLSDAKTRTIWTGDAVHQLAVLEMSPSDTIGIPQGVVLALVSSNLPGEAHKKFVRMYSLSSLCNLVTLMVNQPETVPVDLGRPTGWASAPPQAKRHRPASSITRILSILESPSSQKERRVDQRYSNLATPSSSRHSRASSTPSHPSSSLSSGDPAWDIIDDLPLKWAKDYLPLAPAYLKLADGSVSKFELFQTDDRSKNGPSVLAVGAKNHIYIFESGKGERAFRFAKELCTPFTVAHMRFVYQSTNDGLLMSRHTVGPGAYRHNRNPSLTELTEARSISLRASCTSKTEKVFKTSSVFASQLCLFVSFGERASIIRLSDSAVEEVSLRDDIPPPVSRPYSCDQSQDPATVGPWLPIAYLKFPSPPTSITKNDPEAIGIFTGSLEAVYILTKGRRTHILRSPLPNPASSAKALMELTWKEQPSEVKPRTCIHTELFINAAPNSRNTTQQLQLQLIAFNGTGIEVIEVPISAIQAAAQGEIAGQMSLRGKGKGRALPAPPGVEYVRAKMDLGGEATFLATGGQWDEFKGLGRLERAASTTSSVFDEDVRDRSGVYACYEKGPNDYRVFFIGDYAQGDELVEENDGF